MVTKQACNLGPLSANQRNAIQMAFRWRADSGPRRHAGWLATLKNASPKVAYKPNFGFAERF